MSTRLVKIQCVLLLYNDSQVGTMTLRSIGVMEKTSRAPSVLTS